MISIERSLSMKATTKAWRLANPERYAFLGQKDNAKRRGVQFDLTYDQWLEIWGDDFASRGKSPNEFCMSRPGDVGPYRVGNVKIITNRKNHQERVDILGRTNDGCFAGEGS